MKPLYYDLTPEALNLAVVLHDYSDITGKYRKTIKGKWVLNPNVLNKLLIGGYIPSTPKVWVAWQDLLRQAAFVNQNALSPLTGNELDINDMHLHHALVTKGTIRGMKGFNRNLIHHTYNCMVISSNEHLDGRDKADNRETCAGVLGDLYGKGLVKMWYYSFNAKMKTRLPNIF